MRYKLDRCCLEDILRSVGWTQKDLSDYTGIDKTTVSKYVSKKRTISLLNAVIITETIYERTGKRYSPRDLYEIVRN